MKTKKGFSCNKPESTCHKLLSVFQFSNISDFFVEYMSEVHNCPPPDPSKGESYF